MNAVPNLPSQKRLGVLTLIQTLVRTRPATDRATGPNRETDHEYCQKPLAYFGRAPTILHDALWGLMSDETYVERASAIGGAAEASLEELLTFERLLADLSARFANVSMSKSRRKSIAR